MSNCFLNGWLSLLGDDLHFQLVYLKAWRRAGVYQLYYFRLAVIPLDQCSRPTITHIPTSAYLQRTHTHTHMYLLQVGRFAGISKTGSTSALKTRRLVLLHRYWHLQIVLLRKSMALSGRPIRNSRPRVLNNTTNACETLWLHYPCNKHVPSEQVLPASP